MAPAVLTLLGVFLLFHSSRAHKSSDDSFHAFLMWFSLSPESLIGLLLLGLAVVLSGSIYLWILRYICIGCCQPITWGSESETLSEMV